MPPKAFAASLVLLLAGVPAGAGNPVLTELTVLPQAPILLPGQEVTFQARLDGDVLPVRWRVVEPDGGAIDAARGSYVAPGVEGPREFHIVATPLGDRRTYGETVVSVLPRDPAPAGRLPSPGLRETRLAVPEQGGEGQLAVHVRTREASALPGNLSPAELARAYFDSIRNDDPRARDLATFVLDAAGARAFRRAYYGLVVEHATILEEVEVPLVPDPD